MDQGQVDVLPFVIRDNDFHSVQWEASSHVELVAHSPDAPQWHDTLKGKNRIDDELVEFDNMGVKVEVRRGSDRSCRFHVPLEEGSSLRLVMLCPEDYPVTGPEIALYDESSQNYEPVDSRILDEWNIYRYLADLLREYRGESTSGDGTV